MHPSIPTPQSPCTASAMRMAHAMPAASAVPVTIAMAMRCVRQLSVGMRAPAAGVWVAGARYRDAARPRRRLAMQSWLATAGIRRTGDSPSFHPSILPSRGLPKPRTVTPEESRVNT